MAEEAARAPADRFTKRMNSQTKGPQNRLNESGNEMIKYFVQHASWCVLTLECIGRTPQAAPLRTCIQQDRGISPAAPSSFRFEAPLAPSVLKTHTQLTLAQSSAGHVGNRAPADLSQQSGAAATRRWSRPASNAGQRLLCLGQRCSCVAGGGRVKHCSVRG